MSVHVTRLEEPDVLDYFWAMASSDADRVALLQQLAEVAIRRPADWDGGSVRFGAAGTTARLTADACFACHTTEKHLYWHHVIQVQHGGSNDPRNLVRVCHACHRAVHPWLPAPTTVENRHGWVSVGDLVAHVVERWSHQFPRWSRRG